MNQRSLLTLRPIELSAKAATTADIIGTDKESFINFYTNNKPEKIFVPVADFLSWKGIRVKSEDNVTGLNARVWTLIYRQIAADRYGSDESAAIKKSANSSLLFDVDFLIGYFDEVKAEVFQKVFGGR